MATKIPEEINLHQQSAYLTLKYPEASYDLSAEYLRVYSPSAEVTGHGPGQEKLADRKRKCIYTKYSARWKLRRANSI